MRYPSTGHSLLTRLSSLKRLKMTECKLLECLSQLTWPRALQITALDDSAASWEALQTLASLISSPLRCRGATENHLHARACRQRFKGSPTCGVCTGMQPWRRHRTLLSLPAPGSAACSTLRCRWRRPQPTCACCSLPRLSWSGWASPDGRRGLAALPLGGRSECCAAFCAAQASTRLAGCTPCGLMLGIRCPARGQPRRPLGEPRRPQRCAAALLA